MIPTYKTLASTGNSLYKSKASKFWGFAIPAESKEAIENWLQTLHKSYPDATHICYAWILEEDGKTFKANDDGEPAHSAGTPILNAIRSLHLTYVAVAVVRYYGGSKLGIPGLIEAYGQAAALALQEAGIIEKTPQALLHLRYPYTLVSTVERILHPFSGSEINQVYAEDIQKTISFSKHKIPEIQAKLSEAQIENWEDK